jgi:hypothetical protein
MRWHRDFYQADTITIVLDLHRNRATDFVSLDLCPDGHCPHHFSKRVDGFSVRQAVLPSAYLQNMGKPLGSFCFARRLDAAF